MEKKIKIKSTSLSPLNEALQKLKLNDKVVDFTPVIVEADGKFTSIMNTKEEFNPNDLGSAFETEEVETEEQKETKEQLLNKAKDALKQTLTNSKELNDILTKIQELSKEANYNTWELNKEKNAATLKSKNAQIFKQNNNLCLSHNGKIELFHSVEELHNWLKEKGYPLPGNDIIIHESVEVKENGRNWFDLLNSYNDKKKAEINPITTDNNEELSDDFLYKGLSKRIDKQILQADKNAKPKQTPNRSFLVKDIPEEEPEVEECCGGACVSTAALGPAVTYTATRKKEEVEEDEELQEGTKTIPSIIPGDVTMFPGRKAAVWKFLTWYKRNKPSIESGKIKLDKEEYAKIFDELIEPTFLGNNSDSVSRIWKNIIEKRLTPLANKVADTKKIPVKDALAALLEKPNQQICDLLSQELNSYIPDSEEYAYGKVQLVPGNSITDVNKNSINHQQRHNWQKAYYSAKQDGATDSEVMVKTFNDFKNFIKGSEEDNEFTPEQLALIKKYNLKPIETESTIFESAKNHPWLNKILGQRLTEDDSPADFATGSPISSDMSNDSISTSNTTSDTTTTSTPDIDLDGSLGGAAQTPSFGDININNGYSPDEPAEEAPVDINMPEYKIIDVLIDDDNNDIKVKVQNTDTKETEVKNLEDIDV